MVVLLDSIDCKDSSGRDFQYCIATTITQHNNRPSSSEAKIIWKSNSLDEKFFSIGIKEADYNSHLEEHITRNQMKSKCFFNALSCFSFSSSSQYGDSIFWLKT